MDIRAGEIAACLRRLLGDTRGLVWGLTWALLSLHGTTVQAVTPDSPEVRKLVDAAIGYLEKNTDERLGGRCLVGLVFLKENRPDHRRVREAVDDCRRQMAENPPDTMLDVYSNGLAIIFLCELSPQKYSREIEWYLRRMKSRQMDHGGWGYHEYVTGDTSQTQFATLCYWEALRRGFDVDGASIEKVASWLMKTQDPDGCWGYQGRITESTRLVEQIEKNCSMLAAGLGSAYICADLLGASPASPPLPGSDAPAVVPHALRPVAGAAAEGSRRKFRPQKLNTADLVKSIALAQKWMAANYEINIGGKCYYYLYALERYKSLQEMFERSVEPSPKWYNDGYEFLAKDQKPDGSWYGYCGAPCDTAFATLFLLRSMQRSIGVDLGEGTLLSGRGLPSNLSRAKLRNGELIVEQVHTKIDALLSMLDDDEGVLDELARDPSQLIVDKVDEAGARRLRQLVRGGEPDVRLLAVRALGRTGNLDYVPTLLYALSDPDRRVVIEAREGLKFISRNFQGYGPPDDFTEQQRFQAADAWRSWYKSLRPSSVLEP